MESIVITKKLEKAFDGKEIIKSCNLNVVQGSIYGILGANGVGKTTLFKLLLGLLTPTNGSVKMFGLAMETNRNEILKKVGSLIEVPVFYEHLSARKNLEMHLEYMSMNGDIEGTLELVGLTATNKQPVSEFSLGMRQRLGIARAIIHKPKLLILDEPINGLDPMGIREMRELFLKLKEEQGMTILISSHILSEIEHIADWIGIVVDGRIAQEITMAEVKEQFPNGLENYFFNMNNGGSLC